jgi:transposase
VFPPIPESTVRAARAIYGKGNMYLRLGNHLNDLISRLDPELLTIQADGYTGTFLAVLTLVQYLEGLTDSELTESLHRRVDLRYALHLPNPGPRLDPVSLCAFRHKVLTDRSYRRLTEELFRLLYLELSSDELNKGLEINTLIKSICEHTIRASVVEAMFDCIEALSANHFTWLRQVAPPHWYERYSHSLMMLDSGISIRQKEYTTEDLRVDIEYLLQAADQSNSLGIHEVPEIKTLRRLWEQLLHYRPENQCAYCYKDPFERRKPFDLSNPGSNPAY